MCPGGNMLSDKRLVMHFKQVHVISTILTSQKNCPSVPENINDKKIFTLLEVSQSIQRTLAKRYGGAFWVKAEMNKLNYYPHSGHCYPELVEKKDGRIIAQLRSTLWKGTYQSVNQTFIKVLKEPLKDGIQILFLSEITFSPNYGLSLNIIDIDPSFTLGELEKEKFETIERLKKEGIYTSNKELQLPLLPQRMAIISVQTSKGYADFIKVIEGNDWGYKFFHLLFPALLQGDQAVKSIANQLKRIKKVQHHFDVVAIIRGGGGDIGLTCYNHYELAKEVALFPIPVITGIGHATNETVTEMISFQNAITPTELADFLLQKFHNFSIPVQDAQKFIVNSSSQIVEEEKLQFSHTVKYLLSSTSNMIISSQRQMENLSKSILHQSQFAFSREREYLAGLKSEILRGSKHYSMLKTRNIETEIAMLLRSAKAVIEQSDLKVSGLEKSVSNMHPDNVLKRGYSITLKNGKALKSSINLKEGDEIITKLYEGEVSGTIKSINN